MAKTRWMIVMIKKILLHSIISITLGIIAVLILLSLPTSVLMTYPNILLIVFLFLGLFFMIIQTYLLGNNCKTRLLLFITGCILTGITFFIGIICFFVIAMNF